MMVVVTYFYPKKEENQKIQEEILKDFSSWW
jgi:hypothetical protein